MATEGNYTLEEVVRTLIMLRDEVKQLREDVRSDMQRLEAQYVTRSEFESYKQLEETRITNVEVQAARNEKNIQRQLDDAKPARTSGWMVASSLGSLLIAAAAFIGWVVK